MSKIFSKALPWFPSAVLIAALLSGCNRDNVPPPDAQLDCPSDETWVEQGDVLPDAVGLSTARGALEKALSRFQERDSEMVMVGERDGSLVVDASQVVVAHATEAPAGGWIVLTVTGCGPYEG